jgi:hypothetical protein
VPRAFRKREIELAQPDGNDYVVCTKPPRSCVAVDVRGTYRAYHTKPRQQQQPALSTSSVSFDSTSVGGRLTFELVGGERQPHSARGTLREVATHRVVKTGPVAYDEYVVNLGWIGDGLVLGAHVDEGPGCGMTLYQPLKTWPLADGVSLGDCYGGNVVVQAAPNVLGIVDASGMEINFVDEGTLAIESLEIGSSADPEVEAGDQRPRIVTWLENDESVLVIAYGSASTGDVARVDVKRRKVLSRSSPTVCADTE